MEVSVKEKRLTFLIALTLIVVGVALRLLPHEPNFAPVGAIALFGGAMLGGRYALWLPLAIMMSSDLLLGFYTGIEFTWLGFLAVAFLGLLLRRRSLLAKVGFGAPLGALLFFVISNFGTWLTSGMYEPTLAGFIDCYVAALPFFRMTLLSDLFYGTVLFGLQALALYGARQKLASGQSLHSL